MRTEGRGGEAGSDEIESHASRESAAMPRLRAPNLNVGPLFTGSN